MVAWGCSGASTTLSEFPLNVSACLWPLTKLMGHLWKWSKTCYCWHTSNTDGFHVLAKAVASLTCAASCWTGAFEPPTPSQPSWDAASLRLIPGCDDDYVCRVSDQMISQTSFVSNRMKQCVLLAFRVKEKCIAVIWVHTKKLNIWINAYGLYQHLRAILLLCTA